VPLETSNKEGGEVATASNEPTLPDKNQNDNEGGEVSAVKKVEETP
jgi:hypothetical protein